MDLAETTMDNLNNDLDYLRSILDGYKPAEVSADVDIDDVTGPAFPAKPVWNPLELDYSVSQDKPINPVLTPYPTDGFDYTEPVAPGDIDFVWNFAPEDYTSEMWNRLFACVMQELNGDCMGVFNQAVHDAIVAREQESRRRNQEREQAQALRTAGANGLNLAAGEQGAVLEALAAERMKLDQDSLNNLVVKEFDVEVDWAKFLRSFALDMERVSVDVWKTMQGFGLEAEKAAQDLYLAVYRANIEKYLAAWKGVDAAVTVWKTEVEAITAENLGKIEVFSKQWDAIVAEMKGVTDMNQGLIDERVAEINVYKAEISAVAEQWRISLEEKRVELASIQLDVGTDLEVAKINLGSYKSENDLKAGIGGDIAKIDAQTSASVVGIMSSASNVSYTGTETKSERLGLTAQLSEGHTFRTDLTPAP
jgi:hypothetical protein